jgi:hypothetical protein
MSGKLNSWIFLLLFITAPASTLLAQEGSLLFNRTSFSIYNPAYTGSDGPSVSFNTRSQWKNIEGAPRTNYLIYHMPKKKNVHLGFTAQNDRVFVENKTFFTVDYNYQLQLTESFQNRKFRIVKTCQRLKKTYIDRLNNLNKNK